MANLVGQKLGKYEILHLISRGGMADVYKARKDGLDRDVAIKVMHNHLAHSDDFIARFKREAESIAKLRHPHIVQLYDFDTEGDTYYMVMEFIKGGTLEQLIHDMTKLPPARVLEVAIPLTDALAYAHRFGIIHRDLKPGNIMFDDVRYTHPILTDFGITMIQGGSTITRQGAVIGTPGYMSPEAGLHEPVDKRTDIYSMGVLLYEMLTGTRPYTEKNPFALFRDQINVPLPDPRKFAPDLPRPFVGVLQKALAPFPEHRYQSADELKTALERVEAQLSSMPESQTEAAKSPPGIFTIILDGKPDEESPPAPHPAASPRATWIARAGRIAAVAATMMVITGSVLISSRGLAQDVTKPEPTLQPTIRQSVPTRIPDDEPAAAGTSERTVSAPTATSIPATATLEPVATSSPIPSPSPERDLASPLPPPTATIPAVALLASPSVSSATPSVVPTQELRTLRVGDSLARYLSAGGPSHTYIFTASARDAVFLMLTTQEEDAGLSIDLENLDNDELVIRLNSAVSVACFRIEPGLHNYKLTIGPGEPAFDTVYSLHLNAADPENSDCPAL